MASNVTSRNSIFGDLKVEQEKAVNDLLCGKDVLAVLPTGFGKSRIHQAFASIKDAENNGAVVLVVAPLQSIIQDQVEAANAVSFAAADLSQLEQDELKTCNFKLLFGSAEAVLASDFVDELKNSSSKLHQRLCCLVVDESHTVETWSGKRTRIKRKAKQKAFQSAYGKLSTLRSLCKEGVPLLALTATADKETQAVICKELIMDEPSHIYVSPNRDNLRFTVIKTEKDEIHKQLDWLVNMVKSLGKDVPKTIIFCNTIKEVSVVVNHLVFKLGEFAYLPKSSTKREDLILGIYHSMTWKRNKETILKSLRENGNKRVIIATSALSMGVNFADVRFVVNWGPARTLLDLHQQAGRAGRDGKLSHVIIIYHGHQLTHCEEDVKEFVKAKECLRVAGYKPFDGNVKPLKTQHNCCSNCSQHCTCSSTGTCTVTFPFEVTDASGNSEGKKPKTREVSEEDKSCLVEAFEEIRETLPVGLSVFGSTTAHAFSKELISAITDNCEKLFTLDDIQTYLPVFSIQHSLTILEVLDETFSDVPTLDPSILAVYEQMQLDQLSVSIDSLTCDNDDDYLFQVFQDELDSLNPVMDSDSDSYDDE